MTARWEMDLSPGTWISPFKVGHGWMRTLFRVPSNLRGAWQKRWRRLASLVFRLRFKAVKTFSYF
jgi:hypothetical protein